VRRKRKDLLGHGQILSLEEETLRDVSVIGIGQVPVDKTSEQSLRQMGAAVIRQAMEDAGVERADALYAGNMLADELQDQKHIASLLADEAGLIGIEALRVQATSASGAAALHMGYLAVGSGAADLAIAVGAEKMSQGVAAPGITKALDAELEVAAGATMITKNAELMQLYLERNNAPDDALVNFSVTAHQNARHNPNALFRNQSVTAETARTSRIIHAPLRLMDCSPICDGAAAVVLAPTEQAKDYAAHPVRLLASSVATDRFRVEDRANPLWLEAASISAQKAFRQAGITHEQVDFFEVHDAFSIMACLLLEAAGFAQPGEGWRLAADDQIGLRGEIPITTMGGLKARGHPIGATALYQACEIVQQLTGQAGKNQLDNPKIGMMQSIGGAASTLICHLFGI
jgi:acetyl-CoA C-acetyltransferase